MNWVAIQSFELTSQIMIHEFTTDRWSEWMSVGWTAEWCPETGALSVADVASGRRQFITPALTRFAVEKTTEAIVERPAPPTPPPPRLPDPVDDLDEHGNKQVFRASRKRK